MTVQEVDAVLLCVHKIRQKTIPNDITPVNVTTRSIIVSHLYARMHNTILNCFKFVGLERFIVRTLSHYAIGVRFNWLFSTGLPDI